MDNANNITGNNNIVIQGVSGSTIILLVNGEQRAIHGLVQQEHGDNTGWSKSLREAIMKEEIAVGNKPEKIFRHYGWLIETFLLKLQSNPEGLSLLRRLSFMTETFQSTLRYLCYIQVSQVLQQATPTPHPDIAAFINMKEAQANAFDYLNLLLAATALLPKETMFVPEINDFVQALSKPRNDLNSAAIVLYTIRKRLLQQEIQEDELPQTLDHYLTVLVYWLRRLAFLAKYRMVSIKEINLQYRMGTHKTFVHWYGELHGIYGELQTVFEDAGNEDYTMSKVRDVFTYNQSVLLFKGSHADNYFKHIADTSTYISLSPLVIDQSVLAGRHKQTPEIYYYVGYAPDDRCYRFVHYRNELPLPDMKAVNSNKAMTVNLQNNIQSGLNELFEQLEQVFTPFKNATP
jgi:hypothetical protein